MKKAISIIMDIILYFFIVLVIGYVWNKLGWLEEVSTVQWAICLTIGWCICRALLYGIKKRFKKQKSDD